MSSLLLFSLLAARACTIEYGSFSLYSCAGRQSASADIFLWAPVCIKKGVPLLTSNAFALSQNITAAGGFVNRKIAALQKEESSDITKKTIGIVTMHTRLVSTEVWLARDTFFL